MFCLALRLTGIKKSWIDRHQYCYVHLARNIARIVCVKDRTDFKLVYGADTAEAAQNQLGDFLGKWTRKYSKLADLLASQEEGGEFLQFPKSIRRSIYTTNLIENNNRGLKHHAKLKKQFSNEASLERFVCTYVSTEIALT